MSTDLNTYPNATFLYPPIQTTFFFSSFTIGYNDIIELAWESTFAKPCLTLYVAFGTGGHYHFITHPVSYSYLITTHSRTEQGPSIQLEERDTCL